MTQLPLLAQQMASWSTYSKDNANKGNVKPLQGENKIQTQQRNSALLIVNRTIPQKNDALVLEKGKPELLVSFPDLPPAAAMGSH